MIAYDFPPGNGIGGALRSAFFAQYLPAFGWRARVIALDGGQQPTPSVTRLPSPTPWHRPYEITPYGWAYALRRRLRAWREPVDLIYVSCPPFPQALTAADFARARRIPVVVDFRDAWSLDPYQEGSRLKRALYRHVFPAMEARLLRHTDLLLLNTPSALTAYRSCYPHYAERMAWLPNGFDEPAFTNASSPPRRDHMQLLHAGRFGIGARTPEHLLQGLALVRNRGCDIRLRVLGNQPDWIVSRLTDHGLGAAVELLEQVDYAASVRQMCAADVLVLVQAPTQAKVQAVAGKTYDYLRAGRPVLAIAPDGDNIDLLARYATRLERAEDRPRSIADALEQLYSDWRKHALTAAARDTRALMWFARRRLAQDLAGNFDRLLDSTC